MMSHRWIDWGHNAWYGSGGIFKIVIGFMAILIIATLLKGLFAKQKENKLLDTLNTQYAAGEITKEEFCEILRRSEGEAEEHETALEMLKKRYVAGKVTKDEFEEMKANILA